MGAIICDAPFEPEFNLSGPKSSYDPDLPDFEGSECEVEKEEISPDINVATEAVEGLR